MAWSAPIVVTPPTSTPVAIGDVKTFLRIDGDALDVQIGTFIEAAIDDIEAMTSTRLMSQTVELAADTFADLAHLPIGPATAISEIRYLDPVGAEQLLAPSAYELFGAGLEAGIRRRPGASWPLTRSVAGAVRARLAVGYASATAVPARVHLALLMLTRAMLNEEPADISAQLVNHRIWL